MKKSYAPGLMKARNARQRMQALGELMEFWLGPRKAAYGVPAAQLSKRPLPMPLKWLHEFAGRWPALKDSENSRRNSLVLGCQDFLRPINRIKLTKSGKIEFLDENQHCWVCRTLPEGDDPPVWCEGDFYDAKGKDFVEGEAQICDSLSKFLVTFVLQELTIGSRFILEEDTLKRKFKSAKSGKIPLWLNGKTVDVGPSNFWLWNGSLVADLPYGGWQVAANHQPAIEFLESKRGVIDVLQLTCTRAQGTTSDTWMVSFKSDGSAYACYIESHSWSPDHPYLEPVAAHAPEGRFKLMDYYNSFASQLKARGNDQKDVEVRIYHTGQLGAGAQYLKDVTLFEDLFRQVLAASSGKGSLKLKRLFTEKWRRGD